MAQLINIDPSNLSVFDSIDRVLIARSTGQQSAKIHEELTVPRRRMTNCAAGVSRVSVRCDGEVSTFLLKDRSQSLLTEQNEWLSIDEQSVDAILVILESKDN